MSKPQKQKLPPPRPTLHIRWMIRRDMPEVIEAEAACYEDAWRDDEFQAALACRNCIGMVCELGDHVVGYMVYELHKNRLHVLRFGVHQDFRGAGVGRKLVDCLSGKLSANRRQRVTISVPEQCLGAQLFLRATGFRAVSITGGCIDFAYKVGEPLSFTPTNRVKKYLECEGK